MSNELKPCPFCNGEASFSYGGIGQSRGIYVECIDCAASTEMYPEPNAVKAATSWNTRNAWIPCAERNPEKDGKYLITERYHPTGYLVGIATFLHNKWYSSNVVAWQEIPEAFKL